MPVECIDDNCAVAMLGCNKNYGLSSIPKYRLCARFIYWPQRYTLSYCKRVPSFAVFPARVLDEILEEVVEEEPKRVLRGLLQRVRCGHHTPRRKHQTSTELVSSIIHVWMLGSCTIKRRPYGNIYEVSPSNTSRAAVPTVCSWYRDRTPWCSMFEPILLQNRQIVFTCTTWAAQ